MKHYLKAIALFITIAVFSSSFAVPVLIHNVPSYSWYHGCAPTAAGMIFGYWDLQGYSNLFDAAGSELFLTDYVKNQISSPEHNAKYDPNPDDPNLPVPPNTSIACFYETSVNTAYGGTYISKIYYGTPKYAQYRGYDALADMFFWGRDLDWSQVTDEINAGRPLMAFVDAGATGGANHAVTIFGYEDRGAEGFWYACYNTWHEAETIDWRPWKPTGNDFGVYGIMTVKVIPEPSTLTVLFGIVGGFFVMNKRKK